MQTATVEEVQQRLPDLLDQLGPGDELVIVRDGKPVGKLTPAPASRPRPQFGSGKGTLLFYIDDDEHLKDFEDYMP